MEHAAANPYTAALAGFISRLRYEGIPSEVAARLKLLILDSIGCALFGSGMSWCRLLRETLAAVDDSHGCAVWGTAQRLSAPHAALANGTAVQGFELDDVHPQGALHVGAVTLPPLIAIAESRSGLSGREFLAAAAAGYETGPRVGMCMGQEHIGQGWHSGATVGVFAAAAGAAAGLHLTAAQAIDALGLAGSQSSGLMAAQYGAMAKRMHAGRAAQSGLYAALLAERGFTGIADVFESPYGGFCTTFSRSQDRFNLEELTSQLGERWETLRVALKFYSCVASNHTTLDALRLLKAHHPFGAADVDRITVYGSQVTVDHVGWPYRPDGVTAAQLNLPFAVATLLLEGDVFVDQFDEAAVTDARRIALSRQVEVLEDPAITARGAKARHQVRVEVRLKDGTRMEESIAAARGTEHRFAGESEIVGKFIKLASHSVGRQQAGRIVDMVMNLERVADTSRLAQLLARPAAGESEA